MQNIAFFSVNVYREEESDKCMYMQPAYTNYNNDFCATKLSNIYGRIIQLVGRFSTRCYVQGEPKKNN